MDIGKNNGGIPPPPDSFAFALNVSVIDMILSFQVRADMFEFEKGDAKVVNIKMLLFLDLLRNSQFVESGPSNFRLVST